MLPLKKIRDSCFFESRVRDSKMRKSQTQITSVIESMLLHDLFTVFDDDYSSNSDDLVNSYIVQVVRIH